MSKTKVAFLENRFLEGRFLSSQSEQSNSFQKALIGWKKTALQKSHFCFDHINRLMLRSILLTRIISVTKLSKRAIVYYVYLV